MSAALIWNRRKVRTQNICKSRYVGGVSGSSLRAVRTRWNQSQPAQNQLVVRPGSTRGSLENRAPTAHTTSTVDPNASSVRCSPLRIPSSTVGRCSSGNTEFRCVKKSSTSDAMSSAGGNASAGYGGSGSRFSWAASGRQHRDV